MSEIIQCLQGGILGAGRKGEVVNSTKLRYTLAEVSRGQASLTRLERSRGIPRLEYGHGGVG